MPAVASEGYGHRPCWFSDPLNCEMVLVATDVATSLRYVTFAPTSTGRLEVGQPGRLGTVSDSGPKYRYQRPNSTTMPRADQRASTRTETPDQLAGLARQVRDAANVLEALARDCETLSEPVFLTGWTQPLSTVASLPVRLRQWANDIETQASAVPPPTGR